MTQIWLFREVDFYAAQIKIVLAPALAAVADPASFGMFTQIPEAFETSPLRIDQLDFLGDRQVAILNLMPVHPTGTTSVVVVVFTGKWTSFSLHSGDGSGVRRQSERFDVRALSFSVPY